MLTLVLALVTDLECLTCLQIQIVVAQLQEEFDLLQFAHERSSTELQGVCMEVAGECLPNVVESFEQVNMYMVLLTSTAWAAAFAIHKLATQSTAQLVGGSSSFDTSCQHNQIRALTNRILLSYVL